MTADDKNPEPVEAVLATPHLADALESEQFRLFLDQIPIAIAVSEMKGHERIAYANPEFERLSGLRAGDVEGKSWSVLRGQGYGGNAHMLGAAIVEAKEFVVADDGNGFPEGVEWPKRGRLSALIVRSLRENAKADLKVESSPGKGTRVTHFLTRAAAAPEAKA